MDDILFSNCSLSYKRTIMESDHTVLQVWRIFSYNLMLVSFLLGLVLSFREWELILVVLCFIGYFWKDTKLRPCLFCFWKKKKTLTSPWDKLLLQTRLKSSGGKLWHKLCTPFTSWPPIIQAYIWTLFLIHYFYVNNSNFKSVCTAGFLV